MQEIIVKGDYNDDEQLPLIMETLEKLKLSIDLSQGQVVDKRKG